MRMSEMYCVGLFAYGRCRKFLISLLNSTVIYVLVSVHRGREKAAHFSPL